MTYLHRNSLILGALALFLCYTPLVAQTKKELKATVERLESANVVLTQKNLQLQTQNRKLLEDAETAQATANQAQQELQAQKLQNEMLANEYQAYKRQIEAAKAEEQAKVAAGTFVDPNDTRPCAIKQPQLKSGNSYTLNLGVLNSKGWGVQVYSSDNLCNAMEKAQDFKSYYTMYKTYIRVKTVDGRKIFSVVYGSLKDYQQAKTYCRLFKENARAKEGNGAFLIQH